MFGGSDEGQMRVNIKSYEEITLDTQVGETFVLQTTPDKLSYTFGLDWSSGDSSENMQGESAPFRPSMPTRRSS